jgi:hypothetical protein
MRWPDEIVKKSSEMYQAQPIFLLVFKTKTFSVKKVGLLLFYFQKLPEENSHNLVTLLK